MRVSRPRLVAATAVCRPACLVRQIVCKTVTYLDVLESGDAVHTYRHAHAAPLFRWRPVTATVSERPLLEAHGNGSSMQLRSASVRAGSFGLPLFPRLRLLPPPRTHAHPWLCSLQRPNVSRMGHSSRPDTAVCPRSRPLQSRTPSTTRHCLQLPDGMSSGPLVSLSPLPCPCLVHVLAVDVLKPAFKNRHPCLRRSPTTVPVNRQSAQGIPLCSLELQASRTACELSSYVKHQTLSLSFAPGFDDDSRPCLQFT